MTGETDEIRHAMKAFIYAASITMLIVIAGWMLGMQEYFGTAVSTMGFALLFLLCYATR